MSQTQGPLPRFDAGLYELLENLPDAMLVVGADGRIVHANRLTEKLFGYERAVADLAAHQAQTARQMADALIKEVADYSDGPHRDDVTVAVVKTL